MREVANGANGFASNGAGALPERVGLQQMIDRREYIRLLQQALRRLGFTSVAERLERDSGIQMQPETANRFQQAVLSGSFDEALKILPMLTNNSATTKQAYFLILQQKFVEQIHRGQTSAAVETLRQELGPLKMNQQDLKRLSVTIDVGCLLQTSEDARNPMLKRGPWDHRLGDTREKLMHELQQKLPPALLIPDGRLETLIEQALQAQISRSICHNCPQAGLSLLTDYNAGRDHLPSHLQNSLFGHDDEVWYIQFSHRGDRLASASKDTTARIWTIRPDGEGHALHTLKGHPQAVTHLGWSPDDSKLLTCSGPEVRLWNAYTGELMQTVKHHKETTSACAWFPDGHHFLTSGIDKRIFMCDLQGRVLRHWTMKERITDLVLSPDGAVIICITADRFIELMRLNDHVPVTSIGDESAVGQSAITSISLTPDGEYLLANLKSHTGHLWRVGPIARRMAKPLPEGGAPGPYGLAPEEEGDEEILDEPVTEYHAGEGINGRYVIRSCIGGLDSAFVASGSEDCRVYIWHRDTGIRIARLDGHSGTVNGVAWNPKHPHMLASASDDKSIGIWIAPIVLQDASSRPADGMEDSVSHEEL